MNSLLQYRADNAQENSRDFALLGNTQMAAAFQHAAAVFRLHASR